MYWIDELAQTKGSSSQTPFCCDEEQDINNLPTITESGVQQGDDTISCRPCGVGSYCFVIATSNVYRINSQGIWVQI